MNELIAVFDELEWLMLSLGIYSAFCIIEKCSASALTLLLNILIWDLRYYMKIKPDHITRTVLKAL
jgi:hypothetical protein